MKTATRLLAALAVLAPVVFATAASAQDPTPLTVREINRVPQANLDQLQALGADVTDEDIDDLLVFEHLNEEVSFTAVVLSDPYNSGLASWRDDLNRPGRIHVFVRDTSAVSMGYEGMVTQLVDGSGEVASMQVGFVYDIIGTVTSFSGTISGTIQITPISFQAVGPYQALGLPSEIMEPVLVTSDVLNRVVGQDEEGNNLNQVNWVNFNDWNNQYVRFEDALVTASVANDTGRPNYQWRSSGTEAIVNSDDTSLRFRNDRAGVYQDPFNVRPADDPFIPPPAGATINIQGFVTFPAFDFNNATTPQGAIFDVNPWEDSDLEITASPPILGAVQGPNFVPGDDPVTISIEVTPSGDFTIASVVLSYEASSGESGEVDLTDNGSGVYSGQIPVLSDGAFVTYFVTATDNTGASTTSATNSYRVLYDGINEIEDIQRTASGGPGSSPFAGFTTEMNIEAVVQTGPVEVTESNSTFTILTVQDDPELSPWSGIILLADVNSVQLSAGDRITITEATIRESFGVTRLENVTFTQTGSGEPYGYKVLPTGDLTDSAAAEAHEGILVRFENVTVTTADAGFGGFRFSSTGDPADAVLGEDDAVDVPNDLNEQLEDGQQLGYVQGIWYFSFSNYKVLLKNLDDISFKVDAEEGTVAGTFGLSAAYPNPFVGTTKIAYELGTAGPVTLEIYDALGRTVATLVDAEQAAGSHEATFDARGLAAGVYVYRLTAGGNVLTGRMTLVK